MTSPAIRLTASVTECRGYWPAPSRAQRERPLLHLEGRSARGTVTAGPHRTCKGGRSRRPGAFTTTFRPSALANHDHFWIRGHRTPLLLDLVHGAYSGS